MRFFAITLAALSLAAPALADPSIGIGLGLAFGSGKSEATLGLKVFSNDSQNSLVAAVGLDYRLQAKTIRPQSARPTWAKTPT
jgi:hypothetical protein